MPNKEGIVLLKSLKHMTIQEVLAQKMLMKEEKKHGLWWIIGLGFLAIFIVIAWSITNTNRNRLADFAFATATDVKGLQTAQTAIGETVRQLGTNQYHLAQEARGNAVKVSDIGKIVDDVTVISARTCSTVGGNYGSRDGFEKVTRYGQCSTELIERDFCG